MAAKFWKKKFEYDSQKKFEQNFSLKKKHRTKKTWKKWRANIIDITKKGKKRTKWRSPPCRACRVPPWCVACRRLRCTPAVIRSGGARRGRGQLAAPIVVRLGGEPRESEVPPLFPLNGRRRRIMAASTAARFVNLLRRKKKRRMNRVKREAKTRAWVMV